MVKTAAEWIVTLFAGNVAKENGLLLPTLTGSGAGRTAFVGGTHAAAQCTSVTALAPTLKEGRKSCHRTQRWPPGSSP